MAIRRSKISISFLQLFKWAATVVVWFVTIWLIIIAWYARDLPDIDKALNATRRPTVTLLAADGSLLTTRGDLYGTPIRADNLPIALSHAVLATEDRRFYHHFGIDLIGIGRATYRNLRAGRIVEGGSTITQQVAKNLFLTPERSFKRKIQEVILSIWLEQKFTKNQILTVYLNRAYLGAGTYGVDAAARRYFGVSVLDLTAYESALIAGLLKAPSRYNPRNNFSLAKKRAVQVLKNMVSAGYLNQLEANQIMKREKMRRVKVVVAGRHFIDWVLDQISDYLIPRNRDIIVTTTLNPSFQRAAERRVQVLLDGGGKKVNASQAALVALADDGAVRAMVGGRNYRSSPFNRATQALRQPGSAFKPFVFLTALEMGMGPEQTVRDTPINIGEWSPRNFNRRYQGEVTMTEALAFSINSAAVRIGQKVGVNRIIKTAGRIGITGDMQPIPSLALGTHDVSLINLTAAYVPFANGGIGAWPYGIKEIRNGNGEVLYVRTGSGPGRVVRDDHVAAMNHMMASALNIGTGKAARLDRPAAGKTGTSQNYRDAWFIGYTADLVTGVWMGNDNGTPMKRVTGGGLPAVLWKQFMTDAHDGGIKRSLPGLNENLPISAPKQDSLSLAEPAKKPEQDFLNRLLSVFRSYD